MTGRLVLRGGSVASYDQARGEWAFRESDLLAEDGRLQPIGRRWTGAPSDRVLQLNGALILPAFTNAHTHAFEFALKGFKAGRGIDDPHPEWFWDLYNAFPRDLALLGAELHYAENIAAGVTVIGDVLRADLDPAPFEAVMHGMGVAGRVFGARSGHHAVDLGHNAHATFLERIELASRSPEHAPLHLHYMETAERREQSRRGPGASLKPLLKESGLLGRRWILTHCGAAGRLDMEVFEPSATLVVPTPIAEARLREPSVEPSLLRTLGFRMGFGTDGPCYNPRVDLFEEVRLFHALHASASLSELAEAATWSARPWLVDQAESECAGDVLILDGNAIGVHPLVAGPYDNRLDNIFSAASASNVLGTIANGRLLYWSGEWLDHDIPARQALLRRRLTEFLHDTVKGSTT